MSITFDNNEYLAELFGKDDRNLLRIEKKFNVQIFSRGNVVSISGDEGNIYNAENVLLNIYDMIGKNMSINDGIVSGLMEQKLDKKIKRSNLSDVSINTIKRRITPYTEIQAAYVDALRSKEVVFAAGPAGTGKTYLAVSVAASMFEEGLVDKIILSRPAVEAGEHLGFLPGDLKEKVDPYLRPIYDALHDMIPIEKVDKYLQTGQIEIAPLAFMRGRTLNNAFVILDESQNTTPIQMKMFLTRLGEGSRMAITGDLSQTDLPKTVKSGLRDAMEKLEEVDGIEIIKFQNKDVIRHPLTAKIVQAYEKYDGYSKWESQ